MGRLYRYVYRLFRVVLSLLDGIDDTAVLGEKETLLGNPCRGLKLVCVCWGSWGYHGRGAKGLMGGSATAFEGIQTDPVPEICAILVV